MACLKRGIKCTFFKCCKPVRSDKVHRVEPTLYSLVCFQQAGTTQSVPTVFTQLALPQLACIDSVAFMSIVHTFFWLISPTDAFRDIDYFLCSPPIFLSFSLSHVLAFTLSVPFVPLSAHSCSSGRRLRSDPSWECGCRN